MKALINQKPRVGRSDSSLQAVTVHGRCSVCPKLHSSNGSVPETHNISAKALGEPLHHVGSLGAVSSWKEEEKAQGWGNSSVVIGVSFTDVTLPTTSRV